MQGGVVGSPAGFLETSPGSAVGLFKAGLEHGPTVLFPGTPSQHRAESGQGGRGKSESVGNPRGRLASIVERFGERVPGMQQARAIGLGCTFGELFQDIDPDGRVAGSGEFLGGAAQTIVQRSAGFGAEGRFQKAHERTSAFEGQPGPMDAVRLLRSRKGGLGDGVLLQTRGDPKNPLTDGFPSAYLKFGRVKWLHSDLKNEECCIRYVRSLGGFGVSWCYDEVTIVPM